MSFRRNFFSSLPVNFPMNFPAKFPTRFRWYYFMPAAFFASYLLISRGVSVLPVISGCALAAFLTWKLLSRPS